MYLMKRSAAPRTPVRRSPPAMGDWSDWLVEIAGGTVGVNYQYLVNQLAPAVEAGCLNQANASAAVQKIDAQVNDIAKNWTPSGFYSPQQIIAIVNVILPAVITCKAELEAAPLSTSDATTVKGIAVKDLQRKMDEAAKFTTGAGEAIGKNISVVEAPGLRAWVINTLIRVSTGYVTVATLRCHTTYLDTVYSVLQSIGSFLKKLGNIAIGIGETILKIPDTVSTLWSVLKYGAIAGAGYYVYREYIKK